MTLQDLKLTEDNHFIAMEYYGLILNRTFLVAITDEFLIGLKVNGPVAVGSISGDLTNPYSYVSDSYVKKIIDKDLDGPDILMVKKANFRININDITGVTYNPRKKWGMGPYPHDGKVYISTTNGKRREFIIMGDQSGAHIRDVILGKMKAVTISS